MPRAVPFAWLEERLSSPTLQNARPQWSAASSMKRSTMASKIGSASAGVDSGDRVRQTTSNGSDAWYSRQTLVVEWHRRVSVLDDLGSAPAAEHPVFSGADDLEVVGLHVEVLHQ
jgi:hypothetical protein